MNELRSQGASGRDDMGPRVRAIGNEGAAVPLVSVVVPCFNEEGSLESLYREVERVTWSLPGAEIEYVFVDDGSQDGTLALIKRLREADPRVRFVSLSRNFGKEAAMLAGIRRARGDYVALMDADLQDPPELLADMYAAVVEQGWDCAAARRKSRRGESPVRSMCAAAFYRVFNLFSRTKLVDGARDFRLMTRQMTDAVLSLAEVNRFSKGVFSWVGFRTKWLEYDNVGRAAGATKWSLFDLARYSVEGIVDFSTAPLAASAVMGVLFWFASFIGIVVVVARKIAFGDPIQGWASLVCIVLFAAGAQSLMIALMGQYLSRTYLETKRRPVYVIRSTEE
jgi:glucosyltransferase